MWQGNAGLFSGYAPTLTIGYVEVKGRGWMGPSLVCHLSISNSIGFMTMFRICPDAPRISPAMAIM